MPAKSPAERSLISTIGAYAVHAKYGKEISQPARDASPGSDQYWEREVDPEGELDPAERARRASHAKRAYFSRLALRSAQARRRGKAAP
jgi:hypothetical protein